MIRIYFLIIASLNFLSCNDNVVGPPLSNDELYEFAYSGPKWPSGFYTEDDMQGSFYYENTLSIKPLGEREHKRIELCTDDKSEAKSWSESSSKNSAYYRELISERENEKFFEFRRIYPVNPDDVVLSRVHKCSYIDRSMYDMFTDNNIIGVFNKTDFSGDDVKELIEYLWFVWHYQIGGSKVYKSVLAKENGYYSHTLFVVDISYGDWGVKDTIKYTKYTYTVDIKTGTIAYKTELLKTIEGKSN